VGHNHQAGTVYNDDVDDKKKRYWSKKEIKLRVPFPPDIIQTIHPDNPQATSHKRVICLIRERCVVRHSLAQYQRMDILDIKRVNLFSGSEGVTHMRPCTASKPPRWSARTPIEYKNKVSGPPSYVFVT
jgi:hypothetical protein